jgi:hypothetical protein
MSAFLSVVFPDRIEILTDGAVYDDEGVLVDTREKVYRCANVPAAIVGRGPVAAIDLVGPVLDTLFAFFGFDAGAAQFDNTMRKHADRFTAADKHFELLIAGRSEDRGWVNLYWSTANMYGQFEACRLYRVTDEFGGGPAPSEADVAAVGLSLADLADGMEARGADLLEAMRRKKGPNPSKPDLPELYGIGGHVDLTTIRADGVETKRLRTWPDVVGQKIDPFAAIALAAAA